MSRIALFFKVLLRIIRRFFRLILYILIMAIIMVGAYAIILTKPGGPLSLKPAPSDTTATADTLAPDSVLVPVDTVAVDSTPQ